MKTSVYIKMDAQEPLLLSEGVCRQLGIITYHPSLGIESSIATEAQPSVNLPMVRIRLLQTVRLPPLQSTLVPLQLEDGHNLQGSVLLEPSRQFTELDGDGLQFGDTLVEAHDGHAQVLLTNPTGFTQRLSKGQWVGHASQAECIDAPPQPQSPSPEEQNRVLEVRTEETPDDEGRKRKLATYLAEEGPTLTWQEKSQLHSLLFDHHQAFALDDGERGETDLVQMTIDTGDSPPKRQHVRRAPFAVRSEVARQLREMQKQGVIGPSSSPWASPVVLVKKKDGNLRVRNPRGSVGSEPFPCLPVRT